MKQIIYITGDATKPQGEGTKVIAHVCNDIGRWGKGFVMSLSKRWKDPEMQYRKWYKCSTDFYLGNIQMVKVSDDIFIANMIAQKGLKNERNKTPFKCNAARKCLVKVRECAIEENASVHMPRIGCALGGSTWDVVGKIVEEELAAYDIQVYVYDF